MFTIEGAGWRRATLWPALALAVNAMTWGLSWWPFRQLQGLGLHPLWATVIVYMLALVCITAWRAAAWRDLWRTPSLWVLVLASGTTNAAFNWAVTIGDVVRVVLLFYLMPLWSVLLARLLLHERLSPMTLVRMLLAVAGAVVVLWPPGTAAVSAGRWWQMLPLPHSLADWLGVVGGFTFALNNVMLRREAARPESARALAMFFGGVLVAGVLALALGARGLVPWPPAPALPWLAGVAALGAAFLAGNLALQYGASRLPAHVTAVVMTTEVLFASVSAVLMGAGSVNLQLLVGGGCIVLAALLAALS